MHIFVEYADFNFFLNHTRSIIKCLILVWTIIVCIYRPALLILAEYNRLLIHLIWCSSGETVTQTSQRKLGQAPSLNLGLWLLCMFLYWTSFFIVAPIVTLYSLSITWYPQKISSVPAPDIFNYFLNTYDITRSSQSDIESDSISG